MASMPLALCLATPGRLQHYPGLCHGCRPQAVWLVGLLPSRMVPVYPSHGTADPMGTSALPMHPRAGSAQGSEQKRQQLGLLETNPPEDLSPGFARCRQPSRKC